MNKLARCRKTALLGLALLVIAILGSAAQAGPGFYDEGRQHIDARNHVAGVGASVRRGAHHSIGQDTLILGPARSYRLDLAEQVPPGSGGNMARFGKPLLIVVLILVAFFARRFVRLKP